MKIEITEREHAMILAALRTAMGDNLDGDTHDIATNGGDWDWRTSAPA